jgi:triacylglycerol esterase/lipase EstA (alpha/beta hydrolase family)
MLRLATDTLFVLLAALVAACLFYVVGSYLLAFACRPRPPRLLRAALVELATTMVVLPFWPLWWILGTSYRAVETGEGGEARRPVVLLHGFAMNQTQWLWMGHRLQRRGIGPLYGMTYFSPQTVERSARHLSRFVDRLLRREQATQVDIVAHSLGGLVARYYVERLGGAPHVRRVLTIGSPHHGTELARFGALFPSARAHHPSSSFLQELGSIRAQRPQAAYTSIWSRSDAIIVPPESSAIAPAGEDCVFDDLGHLSLILSPRVIDVVAARLRTPLSADKGQG